MPVRSTGTIPLAEFVDDFGEGLLQAVSEQNPSAFDGTLNAGGDAILDELAVSGPAQAPSMPSPACWAVIRLLVDAPDSLRSTRSFLRH